MQSSVLKAIEQANMRQRSQLIHSVLIQGAKGGYHTSVKRNINTHGLTWYITRN